MRTLKIILATVSGLLLVFWPISHWYAASASAPLAGDEFLGMHVAAGRVSFNRDQGNPAMEPRWYVGVYSLAPIREAIATVQNMGLSMPLPKRRPKWQWRSNSAVIPSRGMNWHWTTVAILIWLPILLTGAWPAASLVLWFQTRRHTPGHCRKCGYDLRGSDSPTCPECGAAAPCEPSEP